VGAFGNEKLFRYVAANADGWITTPLDTGLPDLIALLGRMWVDAGRDGEPEVVALDTTPADRIEEFAELGVTEAVIALPDVSRDDALRHLDDMTRKIDRTLAGAR